MVTVLKSPANLAARRVSLLSWGKAMESQSIYRTAEVASPVWMMDGETGDRFCSRPYPNYP